MDARAQTQPTALPRPKAKAEGVRAVTAPATAAALESATPSAMAEAARPAPSQAAPAAQGSATPGAMAATKTPATMPAETAQVGEHLNGQCPSLTKSAKPNLSLIGDRLEHRRS